MIPALRPLARLRDVDPFECRVVLDRRRRVSVGNIPEVLARVQIDRHNPPVRWFEERQPLRTLDPARPQGDVAHVGLFWIVHQTDNAVTFLGGHVEDTRFGIDRRSARNVGAPVGSRNDESTLCAILRILG